MHGDGIAGVTTDDITASGCSRPWPRWFGFVLPAAVFLATCAAFLPAVWNDFVTLDDPKNFLHNYNYRGLGLQNIRWAWTTFHNGAYQPLSWILFGAQYVAWGLNPTGYHIVSILLQGINAVLFYLVALRLLPLTMPATGRDHPAALPLSAALASLLFAIHPLRTEAVAWLSTQPYLPVGMFYLLSVLAYLRACRCSGDSRRTRVTWLAASCLCYGASILSKGVGVGLIAVLLILDVYPLRRVWPGRAWGSAGESTRAVLSEKVPFLVLGLASALLAVHSKREAMVPVASYDVPHRIVQAAWGVMFYLVKTILPIGLSPWYQFPDGFSVWEPRFVISVILVVVITIGAVLIWKRWPAGTALWAYYLIVLVPLSHLVRLGRQAAADRYSYVSCMGWALLGGAGLLAAWRARRSGQLTRAGFHAIAVGAVAACIFLGGLSWRQSQFWRDGLTLWARAVAVSPNIPVPHNNLGEELRRRGELARASYHLETAIRLDPNDGAARSNLAMVRLAEGRPNEAIEMLHEAHRVNPSQPFAYGNLGAIYLTLGQLDLAIDALWQAIHTQPNDPSARCNLATALILSLIHI